MIKYKQDKSKRNNAWKNDAKRADKLIFYCPDCSCCFEKLIAKHWIHIGSTYDIIYLQDFPSYCKQKEICPKCKESKRSGR